MHTLKVCVPFSISFSAISAVINLREAVERPLFRKVKNTIILFIGKLKISNYSVSYLEKYYNEKNKKYILICHSEDQHIRIYT